MEEIEESLRNMWDIVKKSKMCVIRAPEGQRRENGEKGIFKETIDNIFCKQ